MTYVLRTTYVLHSLTNCNIIRITVSRTISIRLPDELIQRIDSQCNTTCTRNDFVKKAINEALTKVSKRKILKIVRI